ncbi:MAG: hypothetical protein K5945_08125, partial [Bacteroidaceae bacterium]|nr:hypothetical protein [Bacteroidaceae bacterium]
MNLRLPLVWSTACFILGILLASLWPCLLFLPAAVAAVVAQTILRHNVRASVLACIVFWLLLGAGRMSLHRLRPP